MDEDDLIQEDEFFDDGDDSGDDDPTQEEEFFDDPDDSDEYDEPSHNDMYDEGDEDYPVYIVDDDNTGDEGDDIDEDDPGYDPDEVGDDDPFIEPDDPWWDWYNDDDLDPADGDDDDDENPWWDDDDNDELIPDEEELIPEEDKVRPDKIVSGGKAFGSNYYIPNTVNPSKAVHSLQIMWDDEDIFSTEVNDETTVTDLSGINTWNHYGLIPSSRPVIAPPEFRSSFIEIPGADGLLDVSGALSDGYPLYGRRKGDIEFYVTRDYDTYYSWSKVYSSLMSNLHGRLVKCILMDDPAFYYRGRITVNQWRSEKDWSKIVLNYDFEPYKYALFSTRDRWLWDPFDFVEGVVTDPVNYFGANSKGFELYSGDIHDFIVTAGDMRFVPKLVMSNDEEQDANVAFEIRLWRRIKNLDGEVTEKEVTLGDNELYFKAKQKSVTTVNVYNACVKNGSYRLRIKYTPRTNVPLSTRVGLLYRYGCL